MVEESPKAEPPRAARRQQLAEAALRVLSQEGHARLTARKVAAEAGLALGHITYNFASMDEVLAEAYRIASDRLRAASGAALQAQGTPMSRIEAFIRTGFTPDFLNPAHLRLRVDLWAAALWHPGIAETERQLYARYRAALMELLQGMGEPEAIEEVADTVMAALDGLWADYARRQDSQAVERGLKGCLSLITLRLAPTGSA
jgi:AcrR family transcriptional regulator